MNEADWSIGRNLRRLASESCRIDADGSGVQIVQQWNERGWRGRGAATAECATGVYARSAAIGPAIMPSLVLARWGSRPPLPALGQYRTPVPNVYLCGSGAHPGSGITMAPGRNAARVILTDFDGAFA